MIRRTRSSTQPGVGRGKSVGGAAGNVVDSSGRVEGHLDRRRGSNDRPEDRPMRQLPTTNARPWPAVVDARAFGSAYLAMAVHVPSCTLAIGHKPEPRRTLTS